MDEVLRLLERDASISTEKAELLSKELRRIGQAFDSCDWCWGNGFRVVMSRAQRCDFCSKGEPEPREEKKHIADELPRFHSPSHWRDTAHRVVDSTMEGLPKGATAEDARRALRRAYPFGPRQYHPYKVWLEEVNKGLRKRFGSNEPAPIFDGPRAEEASK